MILGIDPGTRRVGIAAADEETRVARPVETVAAAVAIARIAALVSERDVHTVVVGRPVSLSGNAGPAVETYEGFIAHLRHTLADVEVVEFDERLTSRIAERQLRSAGLSTKKARGVVDAVAAQVMLQGYLDTTRDHA